MRVLSKHQMVEIHDGNGGVARIAPETAWREREVLREVLSTVEWPEAERSGAGWRCPYVDCGQREARLFEEDIAIRWSTDAGQDEHGMPLFDADGTADYEDGICLTACCHRPVIPKPARATAHPSAPSPQDVTTLALTAFARSEHARAQMMKERAHTAAVRALAACVREDLPTVSQVELEPHSRGVRISTIHTEDGAISRYPQGAIDDVDDLTEGIVWELLERPSPRGARLVDLDAVLAEQTPVSEGPVSGGPADEHVYLVAFTMTAPDRRSGHLRLHEALSPVLQHPSADSWWVAEPDRLDGSDCANAEFTNDGPHGEPCN